MVWMKMHQYERNRVKNKKILYLNIKGIILHWWIIHGDFTQWTFDIACRIHVIIKNTLNLTTYWKIPLKITLFNPLLIWIQYTFPISKTPTFTRYCRYPFFINIFYTPLYFFINFKLHLLYTTHKNHLILIMCSIYMSFFVQYIPPNMNTHGIVLLPSEA